MSSLCVLGLRLVHSALGLMHWCYQRIRGYPYPASVRINQKGGIYFLAREAYFEGDEVVLRGVVRAAGRTEPVTSEWPVREETTRIESLRNVVWWTAWGFSKRRLPSPKPQVVERVSSVRPNRLRRRPELVTERS